MVYEMWDTNRRIKKIIAENAPRCPMCNFKMREYFNRYECENCGFIYFKIV